MSGSVPLTHIVSQLPATVPFVAPEAIERQRQQPIILRLGANESTFGPSPRAAEAMREAVSRINYYADPESHDLRAAISRLHGVGMGQVVVGSGIDDLLGLIVRAVIEPESGTAVTSLGAYPTFNYHVTGYGGRIQAIPYREVNGTFAPNLDALAEAAHQHAARIVYLSSPDNPTGSYFPAAEIQRLLNLLPSDCFLLFDEAYIDFAPSDAHLPFSVDDQRLLRVRTFSKAHGMAGARVGCLIASEPLVGALEKIRLHFGVNLVAQVGALASLNDPQYIAEVVAEVACGREEYAALARELGLIPLPSATNFVAIDTGSPERAKSLLEALAARNVFIRMPGASPLNRCVRVTVGTAPERAQFASILREVWPQVAR